MHLYGGLPFHSPLIYALGRKINWEITFHLSCVERSLWRRSIMDIKALFSRYLTFSRTSLDFGQFCGAGGWCDGMRPSWETCGGGYRDTCSQSARNLTSRQSAFQECNTSQIIFSLSLSLRPDAAHVAYFLVQFFRGLNTPGASVCSVCAATSFLTDRV